MSIAEFYIDHGIDPSQSDYISGVLDEHWEVPEHNDNDKVNDSEKVNDKVNANDKDKDTNDHEPNGRVHVDYAGFTPFAREVIRPSSSSSSASSSRGGGAGPDLGLTRQGLDALAARYGYSRIETSTSTAPMLSYRRGACRLNFWPTTGTVGSYLLHPKRGKTQLFRRDVDLVGAEAIFENPRVHTGRGYGRRPKNNAGANASANRSGGRSRGPCRYGENCYRVNCPFAHSKQYY